MIRAYSMLTKKNEAVTIYYDQQRLELCRDPHIVDDLVKWERHRASNVLAAFAVERRLNSEIQGDYRNDTLKTLDISEEEIEAGVGENQGKGTGAP